MSRTYKIILVIFLLLLGLLTYLEAKQPAPVNWNPSYSASDKIPLGTFVLFQSLKEQDFQLKKKNKPPYEFLNDSTSNGTYFFLNDQLLFDDAELEKLLEWVNHGNTVFLASDAFSKNLLDTLNLNIATSIPTEGISSKPMMNLTQPEFEAENAYLFDHEGYHSVFTEIDTLQHTILGVSELFSDTLKIQDPKINYLKINFGEGEIYMHTTPKAFSNFFMLDNENFEYVEKALAYLPTEGTLYWDQYYKAGKVFTTSPLYILLNNNALKWAYYFAILGCIMFVLFEGKRKQRSIPVVKPLQNQTFEFTQTVAGLYLEKKEFREITDKKIALFLEYVRVQLRTSTSKIDAEFYDKLAAIREKPVQEVKELFFLIREMQNKNTITKDDLLKLNSAIHSFKNENDGKQRNGK